MNYVSVPSSDADGSEDDGINVVLLGGILIVPAVLLAAFYLVIRAFTGKR